VELEHVTGAVIDESIRIHRRLGPGVFESVYETVLASLLARRGLHVERQRAVSFTFDDMRFDQGFRIDLLVEHSVIVEVKSLDRLAAVHRKQLLTYLRLTNLRVGLLLNFGAETMREGIVRVVSDR
jgi:iron complex transport system substrate-binding protein